MFVFAGFRLHMLAFCSIFINLWTLRSNEMKTKYVLLCIFSFKKKSQTSLKRWHSVCFVLGIMRSRSSLSLPRCFMEQKTTFSRRGETDANLYMRTCTLAGLGVTCHNILETAPPVNRLVIPAQFVPFNSWCIIHSVSHSHTHRQKHTHILTHTLALCLSLYESTLEGASSSSAGGARESGWY